MDKAADKGGRFEFVLPMLAKRVPALPEGPQWSYELKFDGYRMEALKDGSAVRLLSRNGADYTARFRQVAEAVAKLKPSTLILDGEIVVVDQPGKPSFKVLQNRKVLPRFMSEKSDLSLMFAVLIYASAAWRG